MYLHIYTLCSQFLGSQDYTNCIRTEDGFCGIEWKEKSGTSNGECITILLVFPHFKSKKLLVPCFELSPPRCFLPLWRYLSDRSGCLSNHEHLHSQPQVKYASAKNTNQDQAARWIFVSVTTESKPSPPPPQLLPLLPLTNTRVRFLTIHFAVVIYHELTRVRF